MEKTFVWEGGIANDPDDRGGFTNMGITRSFYTEYLGRPASDADIAGITKERAIDAYFKNLWVRWRIAEYPDFLRLELFNSYTGSVALGRHATTALQRLVNLTPDGLIGPQSIAKFREVERWGEREKTRLNNAVVREIIGRLIDICRTEPSQLKWLRGWWNRYSEFFDTIDDPSTVKV